MEAVGKLLLFTSALAVGANNEVEGCAPGCGGAVLEEAVPIQGPTFHQVSLMMNLDASCGLGKHQPG